MKKSDERKLKQLNERQSFIIRNYCNAVGCRDCPLNRKPDDCESINLQDKILEIEFKYL